MLEVTRPSREFGCSVQFRQFGRVRRETLTARAETPQQGIATLRMMADLRYGPDSVMDNLAEFIVDITHPVRFD